MDESAELRQRELTGTHSMNSLSLTQTGATLAYLDSKVSFFRLCESSLPGQLGSSERPLPDKLHKAELLVML